MGRRMAVKASLLLFFGGLFWGVQLVLFHLNDMLPAGQNVHALYAEKLGEGHYRIKILGEGVYIKLPDKEEVNGLAGECLRQVSLLNGYTGKITGLKPGEEYHAFVAELKEKSLSIMEMMQKLLYKYQQLVCQVTWRVDVVCTTFLKRYQEFVSSRVPISNYIPSIEDIIR
ncbi:hypothetical protein Dtox_3227 [Desulfofarcimen acetoxidans DSM 771]|uniref:Uncharacterized protein n=1 Tax=Desulfofarcimen acetoxidans (strain ATCC 49208 / DSM 771 / KCTC 5769 / VKM B-1644 / 5575) TaxID=485916 RepID=C8W4T1_DESAS|nr:hypothetical protein [Desulfofarcimen acetoxidans]ACV63967.1 hypothetical protein Dtox_3227 [Desulfofarcimen acetoxidans DSM 771]